MDNPREQTSIAYWQRKADEKNLTEPYGKFLHFITSFYDQKIESSQKTVFLKSKQDKRKWMLGCYLDESSHNLICFTVAPELYLSDSWLNKFQTEASTDEHKNHFLKVKIKREDVDLFLSEAKKAMP